MFKEEDDGGVVTVALYMDLADPTLVTVLLKVALIYFERVVDRAKDGRLRSKTLPVFAGVQVVLLSPVILSINPL